MKHVFVFVFVIFLVGGCKKDNNNPSGSSGLIYSYSPSNVGHELIYDVTLITKDEFTGIEDTSIYQLREIIESIIIDNQGRPTQRLERYVRDTPGDPWVIDQVWTANLTATNLERKEDNITYVKMVFPLSTNVTWNGNVFNTIGMQDYYYDNIHVPGAINSFIFDSTCTIIQKDEDNAIETYFEVEQFANHVGLVYKQQIEKLYKIPNQPEIESQRLYTQTLNSYSN